MNHSKALGALALAILAGTTAGAAEDPALHLTIPPPTRITPAEIPWPGSAPNSQAGSSMQTAVQNVVIFGDAAKPGLYSIMFRVAPNARIPAHHHPDDRSCFVLSGVWYFGHGESFSEAGLRALPAGSHYAEPANVNHFAGTRSEGATAECTSVGPSGTVFAAPSNDPRH